MSLQIDLTTISMNPGHLWEGGAGRDSVELVSS